MEENTMEQTYITLNDGNKIPQFGLGVFQIPGDEKTKEACLEAFKLGYRHIDTAHAYQNERGVGQAVKESGIPREEIWITTKLVAKRIRRRQDGKSHRQNAGASADGLHRPSCCCINSSGITWAHGKIWKKLSLKVK
jgi:diketogulonate reductase-like aldo/keto reductase